MDTFMNQYLDPHPSVGVIERLTAVRNNKVSIMGPERAAIAAYTLVSRFLSEFAGLEDVKGVFSLFLTSGGIEYGSQVLVAFTNMEQKYGIWSSTEPAGAAWAAVKAAWFAQQNPTSSLIAIMDTTLTYALSTYSESERKLAIQALLISQGYFLDQFTAMRIR